MGPSWKTGDVVVLKCQKAEKHKTLLRLSSLEFLFNCMQTFNF